MVKKEIKLLQQQIDKLYAKDFDFEAWKKYSLLQLARIFGDNDPKIAQMKGIEFEFNSWSLRDASGNESYEEGSKRLAKEVLQAAIDELDIYGLPNLSGTGQVSENEILTVIIDEMKGSQVKELKAVIRSDENISEKKRRIRELFEDLGEQALLEIITNIVSNPKISSLLSE